MSTQPKGISGWVALLCALLLWGAVIYAYMDVENRKREHFGIVSGAQEQARRDMVSSRLRSFMAETQRDRQTMEAIASTDILSVVAMIEESGKAAGVEVEISSASPERSKGLSEFVSAVVIMMRVQGTYSSTAYFLSLISTLPVPLYISQLDLVREENATKQVLWKSSIRASVITTSKISS